jgi:ribonuclease D
VRQSNTFDAFAGSFGTWFARLRRRVYLLELGVVMKDSNFDGAQPFISFPGRIHLVLSDRDLELALPDIEAARELGFDTETRPSFKKGDVFKVALLQLATPTDAYLIRLHHITQFQAIKSIFENPGVLKVGAAIRDDLKQLQTIFKFVPQNFVELQNLAKSKGLTNLGLKSLTQEVLGANLSKGPKTTNWENPTLTDKQLLYAATDAWIGLKLYHAVIARP